ncbi:LPS translocon maturation chaperone LptM [Microvirga aerilata]|nr:lipoprotein [Microvirga aerilata]
MARHVALFRSSLKSLMLNRAVWAITMPWSARAVVFVTLPLASQTASRYGAATFRSLLMSSSLTFPRIALVAGLLVLGLSACGRRGALEPPPNASAPAAETQQQATTSDATLPSPVGTPRSGSPNRGPTVPNKPFILDPLL